MANDLDSTAKFHVVGKKETSGRGARVTGWVGND